MIRLPYKKESIDCILCRNVISHTDTEGIKIIIEQIYNILRKDGECFLTLGSKNAEVLVQRILHPTEKDLELEQSVKEKDLYLD